MTQVGFLSTPAETVRIGKKGVRFLINENNNYVQMKAEKRKPRASAFTLNKEELRPYLNYALAPQCEMVMQN